MHTVTVIIMKTDMNQGDTYVYGEYRGKGK